MLSRRVATVVAVAVLAGCSGGSPTTPAPTSSSSGGGPASEVPADVDLEATDDLHFSRRDVSTSAGTVTIRLTCGPAVPHDFVIEGVNGDEPLVACDPGQAATGAVELEPGNYTFYCSIPGHRATMEGRLAVS